MEIQRGLRDKLEKYINVDNHISVSMKTVGKAEYDYCCFGVDANGKLSDDRYMVFYNQPHTPKNEIAYSTKNGEAIFDIQLNQLPPSIVKLVFTVSIDGNGTMGEISSFRFALNQPGKDGCSMMLSGKDFHSEKAIITVELYKKDVWRFAAVASGFNGGLGDLLRAYGGEEVKGATENSSPYNAKHQKTEAELTNEIMGKINLSKDKANLEKHVVNLSKTVVNLSKKSGVDLGALRAKVVVVLDYSYSMESLYKKGAVQKTIDKLVPLGLTFDDNGSIDVYLFQNDYRKMSDLNLGNYEKYISNVVEKSRYSMGGTDYAPVLKAVIDEMVDAGDPTFVLFITDGENSDKRDTDLVIRRSSELNVFIQFIGIGNSRFTYLEQLDDMPGRKRDNTGFSKMVDLAAASDETLYTNVLDQFSQWLKGFQ